MERPATAQAVRLPSFYRIPLGLVVVSFCFAQGPPTARHAQHVMRMEATAFAKAAQPTAAGTVPHDGIVAADPAILPLGTRIRITGAGAYNGYYLVTDTGAKIVGLHIDLYMPSAAEAKVFGKKLVYVRVLQTGDGKKDAREKDIPAATTPK